MLSDEEKKAIEEQYKEGLVNLSNVIEPLINQFKTDYSLDIQQCRLIINYLLMERDFNETYYDELDKEIEELKEKNRQSKMRIVQLENEITARIEDVNQYYTPNDKIKAKIEEYKKEIDKLYKKKNWYEPWDTEKKNKFMNYIEFGQSLLEKE